MIINDIGNLRLTNQHLTAFHFKTVEDLVQYMGAMQAQDYAMAKWAIGCRIPGSTDKLIEDSISKADIIRTHLMRPTWHLVSAKDIYWLLELTGPQIKSQIKSRQRELELSEGIINKSYEIIEQALEGNKALSRTELNSELEKRGIATHDQRSAHIMVSAELDGLVCSGPTAGKQQTYALLKERVPVAKRLDVDEALAELAKRYFKSHGPATPQDFMWWSGLSVTKVKKAIELIKGDLDFRELNGNTFWFDATMAIPNNSQETFHLLPAYDEFMISYKDRSACLTFEHQNKTLSNNGIFRPIIVQNGLVTGIWSRTIKKDKVFIKPHFFKKPNKKTQQLLEKSAMQFAHFLGLKAELE